jgi:hypothetical protein
MAKVEAGIPTTVAMAILVAERVQLNIREGGGVGVERKLTDITPDWSPIDDVSIPDDGIDEPDERRKAAPENEQTRASVPG